MSFVSRYRWSIRVLAYSALHAGALGCSSTPSPAMGASASAVEADFNADGGQPAASAAASAPVVLTAHVAIDSTRSSAVPAGYSGFNTEVADIRDTHYRNDAATLRPAWLRFNGGDSSQAFDWCTGLPGQGMLDTWRQKQNMHYDELAATAKKQAAVGGQHLVGPYHECPDGGTLPPGSSPPFWSDFANKVGAAGLVISVNGFTDTAASAGMYARAAAANQVPILAWELANEAYLYPTFFADGETYATDMAPFAAAIRAADRKALVAVYADRKDDAWYASVESAVTLGKVSKFWNAVSVHDYPGVKFDADAGSTAEIEQRMAFLNDYLVNQTPIYASGTLAKLNLPVIISEFAPGLGAKDPFAGSIYDGVYSSEYIVRLSTGSPVRYIGMHGLTSAGGIDVVPDAGSKDFVHAQIMAVGVANDALRDAQDAYATKVTGGAMLPTTTTPVPALFAQAYRDEQTGWHLVVTNKGGQREAVDVTLAGVALPSSASVDQVGASDPRADNTLAGPSTIAVQHPTLVSNPTLPRTSILTVPPYSVTHVSWK